MRGPVVWARLAVNAQHSRACRFWTGPCCWIWMAHVLQTPDRARSGGRASKEVQAVAGVGAHGQPKSIGRWHPAHPLNATSAGWGYSGCATPCATNACLQPSGACTCDAGWTSSRSYALSTSNQDASGFHINGFSDGDMLLVSIALANAPAGASLRLAATSGLTASTGYNINAAFSRISFTASKANANLALAALKLSTGGAAGTLQISVSATINDPGFLYLPTVGHYYACVHALALHALEHARSAWRRRQPMHGATLCVAPTRSRKRGTPVHYSCACTAGLQRGRRASPAATAHSTPC